MSRMTKRNLHNIKCIFEEKTGVDLNSMHRMPTTRGRKLVVLAAVVAVCLMMAAFAYPLFTPLDGDELSLSGTYEGNGIVSIYVENGSDKDLKFQEQTKLMRWVTGEEVERLEGNVVFSNTEIAAHTSGIMTVDLSAAYDMEALEQSDTNAEWFYLLLTNQNFLFGHDWMCSVNFGKETAGEKNAAETQCEGDTSATNIDQIEEELRFYFQEAYNEVFAFNGANFAYQQKVEEVLMRFEGNVVPALSPMIMVSEPSLYLDPEPIMGKPPAGVVFDESIPENQQYLLTLSDWEYTDAYGRMVASRDEKAWVQTAVLPQHQGQTDGGVTLPLIFLFVYDAEAASDQDNYAFIYGQLHSFGDLEQYKVLEDAHYAIYDATDLIYTDLDAYLDYFLTTREDVFCDEQIRQRVHNIYAFYQDKENIQKTYGYLELE